MTEILGTLAYLLLPLLGLATMRLPGVRSLSRDGRITIAAATGALLCAVTMWLLWAIGIEWSRTSLGIIFAIYAAAGVMALRSATPSDAPLLRQPSTALSGIWVLHAAHFYGLFTARLTCADYYLFWAPKGIRFFRHGGIDVAFLGNPHYFLAHADYPPLLPLLYAWSHTVSHQFAWWGGLALTGLCMVGIVALVRSGSRSDAMGLAAASVLIYAFSTAIVGGAADGLLVFFEALVVCAIVFIDDPRSRVVVAAVGLGAAILTKVEGVTFAIAVAVAMLLVRIPWKQVAATVAPAGALLAGWLLVVKQHGLFDTYGGPGKIDFTHLQTTVTILLEQAQYHAYGLPWLVPILLIILGNARRALFPLLVCAATTASLIYFYLHSPTDPTWWIRASAARVLLTPLTMLVIAAAAAHTEPRSVDAQRPILAEEV